MAPHPPLAAGDPLPPLVARWREDPGGTYQAWFLWEERLKNFRSIRRGIGQVVAEIEAGTFGNIYSGIVRLLDLALGSSAEASRGLYLVAPDQREADVRAQLARPAFSRVGELQVRFLPYSELEQHRHSMARFGQGMKAIEAVARSLS